MSSSANCRLEDLDLVPSLSAHACRFKAAGACTNSVPNACDDANFCTADSCDEANDICVNNASAMDTTPCDDGLFCTGTETCVSGNCQSSGDPCSSGETCNETADTCDSGGCGDGSWEPVGEWCLAGGRVYGVAINALTLEIEYRYARQGEEIASAR